MARHINWRLFAVLWAASVLTSAAVIPYIIALGVLNTARLPISLGTAVALQIAQSAVLFAVLVFVGLLLARATGLGAPFLEAWLGAEKRKSIGPALGSAAALGASAGLVIFVLDRFLFLLVTDPITAAQASPPLWARMLASLYGGVAEEVAMRLFLMTLLVWISWKVRAAPDGGPTAAGVWIAIVLVAAVFGLGHLPVTAQIMDVTPWVVVRALALNGVGGVLFGWLYWRHGLESAMAAHFSTDVALHVLLPGLL